MPSYNPPSKLDSLFMRPCEIQASIEYVRNAGLIDRLLQQCVIKSLLKPIDMVHEFARISEFAENRDISAIA